MDKYVGNEFGIFVAVLAVVFLATVIVYQKVLKMPTLDRDSSSENRRKELQASTAKQKQDFGPSVGPGDVWEERRRKGIVNSTSTTKQSEHDKPFGSSYYYAHNNPGAKGGYSDGLCIEDYTMNGPRLLSRGGQSVGDRSTISSNKNGSPSMQTQPSDASNRQKPCSERRTRQITRYLWDDEGDEDGVAVIRVDNLPGPTSATFIDWRDANVTEVTAKLIGGGGLLVSGTDNAEKVEYRLYVKQLYGPAVAVKAVVKAKRLLVRIYKKKDKSNLKAWPHPQKRM
jgi:hypothetical protein